jgi:flagellin
MSVVINTNTAASIASNNLAASNQLLQRGLNRLSSGSKIVNPADDAGGLAVSMKLSAAARRQGAAATNIANGVSFLQTQDGALKVAGKVLERIGELKTLSSDPTKNSDDRANYQAEFAQLQNQLNSITAEKFNGQGLFGTTKMSVATTAESGGSTVDFANTNLMGYLPGDAWSNVAMSPADWTSSDPSISISISTATKNIVQSGEASLVFHGDGTLSTNQSITGPFTISFVTSSSVPDSYSSLSLSAGGNSLDISALLPDSSDHEISIVDDGTNATVFVNGVETTTVATLSAPGGGPLTFTNSSAGGDFHVARFSLINTGGGSGYADVANATSLDSLALSTLTDAISEVATFRADNGAQQSRLGFAAEVLTVNKANLEAANSRITDVDVAQESTQLARFNILVQAGTAMLSQANQSAQAALRLIG